MQIIERGSGDPLVLVPGIQGRWEYMRPAIDALSRSFRVLTFPLCGEPDSLRSPDPGADLDNYSAQVLWVLDQMKIDRAILCGVSFGGLVALRFAACHDNRVTALVLASTPAPVWRLRRRHQMYTRAPWIFGPMFLAESPWRLRAEIAAAIPDRRRRWSFRRAVLRTFAAAPLSVARMAARARLIDGIDMRGDCARVTAPTLIITGEHLLDHVVSTTGSSTYAQLIPDAHAVVLERTGHLGSITRPDAFAALVRDFVDGVSRACSARTESTGRESTEREPTGTEPTEATGTEPREATGLHRGTEQQRSSKSTVVNSVSPFLCGDPVTSVLSGPVTSVLSGPVTSVLSGPVTSVLSGPVTSVISLREN